MVGSGNSRALGLKDLADRSRLHSHAADDGEATFRRQEAQDENDGHEGQEDFEDSAGKIRHGIRRSIAVIVPVSRVIAISRPFMNPPIWY